MDSGVLTLWMGDLEAWMDETFIKNLWRNQYGEEVNIKMIKDKVTGANAGYCFVEFQNTESCQMALTLNGQQIPGTSRIFKLNWASGGGLNDRKGPEYSIFVGDLGPEVTDELLLSLFQQVYPSCKAAKVVTDPVTNASRGYGFVRFSEELEQQRALQEMQGAFCGNRPIRISVATPKSRDRIQGSLFSPSIGISYMPPMNQFTDPTNTTIFVGGLSPFVTEDELRSYFQPYGPIAYVKIPPGKGCGFVQFADRPAAEHAITALNGVTIGGSRIRLSWGRSHTRAFASLPPVPTYPVFTAYPSVYRIAPNPVMVTLPMPVYQTASTPSSSSDGSRNGVGSPGVMR